MQLFDDRAVAIMSVSQLNPVPLLPYSKEVDAFSEATWV
jgi:hypothetical protein